MSELNINNVSNISTTNGDVKIGVIENNLYHSADWQKMQTQYDKLLQRIQKYPDVAEFQKDLDNLTKQMDDFRRDVLKLAEEFQHIAIDTERLKLAHDHFQKGEFREARAILDTKKMGDEQDKLLQLKQTISSKLDTINEQLAHNATEWLIKARLTAIDYDLKEARIPKSRECFERALKANRSPEYLFEYAKFLQDDNQFQDAEQYYREVLAIVESLAKQQPNVYLPYVAITLNNLANLLSEDPQQRQQAQQYYEQALDTYQQLANQQPNVYLPYVAITQNNLAILLSKDPQQRQLAQQYYESALITWRNLVENYGNQYRQNLVQTLLAYSCTYLQWGEPHHALPLLQEAKEQLQPLLAIDPEIYGEWDTAIQNLLQISVVMIGDKS